MRWFKKPFSECFGVSPGEPFSPGLYRISVLSKVFFGIALCIFLTGFMRVDAATVSDGDSSPPVATEAPVGEPEKDPEEDPGPTSTPVPTVSPAPEYVIENEVNLDGANLYSSSDSVTVYTQAVVLALEEEGTANSSAFPQKSGYFVVPISDTECAYVPEGYDYWIVCNYGTLASNYPFYLCTYNSKLMIVGTKGNLYQLYNYDGSLSNQNGYFTSSLMCEHGHNLTTNPINQPYVSVTSIYGKNITYCGEIADGTENDLESISLSSDSILFESQDSQSLTATVVPEGFSGELVWISTDESVAKYSGGLVVPMADGECRIIASYVNSDGSVVSASCNITVSLPVVDKEPTELEAFLQEPIEVNRYQYEILKRMEFMQYAQALMIALIFILIFKRK